MYYECLMDGGNWQPYAKSPTFSVEDMAMLACKDLGCAINYCRLLNWDEYTKGKGQEQIALCGKEFDAFNACMTQE